MSNITKDAWQRISKTVRTVEGMPDVQDNRRRKRRVPIGSTGTTTGELATTVFGDLTFTHGAVLRPAANYVSDATVTQATGTDDNPTATSGAGVSWVSDHWEVSTKGIFQIAFQAFYQIPSLVADRWRGGESEPWLVNPYRIESRVNMAVIDAGSSQTAEDQRTHHNFYRVTPAAGAYGTHFALSCTVPACYLTTSSEVYAHLRAEDGGPQTGSSGAMPDWPLTVPILAVGSTALVTFTRLSNQQFNAP